LKLLVGMYSEGFFELEFVADRSETGYSGKLVIREPIVQLWMLQ